MVRSTIVTLKAESRTEQLTARISELEAALAREERITAALREVGVALGTTLDLDQLLELILQKITDLLDADRATLYLLDEAREELVSRIAVGDAIRSVSVKVGEGIAGIVARTGKTIRVRDAYRDKRFTRKSDELPGYRTQSILAAPMKNHLGRIIGVVHVLNKKSSHEFTANDESLLDAFATEAAVSIDNSRLFLSVIQKNMLLLETKEKLEQSVRHLKLLFELESTMGRASSEDDLVCGVLRESAQACEATGGALLLADARGNLFELSLWDAEEPGRVRHETWRSDRPEDANTKPSSLRGVLSRAVEKKEPIQAGKGPDGSVVAVPLEWDDGAPLGAMALCNKSDQRRFASEDVELLRIIAANFCTAIRLFRSRTQREIQDRLSTIGSLLSSVVHDLKTPMAVISGAVQMMTQAEEAAKRQEYAALVLKQFDSIAAMQREVLEFARGEKRLLVRRVYLGKFFEELASELRSGLSSKVLLVLELDDRTTARFDQNKVTRAVHNLVRNAVEAMGQKGGQITLRVARRQVSEGGDKKRELVLEVADNGPGIPKEIEGRVFDSFVSAGKSGGTGLGLAIVKKIAEEHGGTVGVQSSSQGTTFTLVIPQDDPKP
ncbi:MAG TPA: GAF domain-containing protein [Polyangiaceae bacterium]|nr:GAF domain-containing protein [Polyangiaceae bacterium]